MIRVEHIPLGPVTTIMTAIPSAHTAYTVARFGRPSHTAPDDLCGGASLSAVLLQGSPRRVVNSELIANKTAQRWQRNKSSEPRRRNAATPASTQTLGCPHLVPAAQPAPRLSDAPNAS
ncbi:hypothetical protein DFP72DRAFT_1074661 [Ephemerocybe angulata]|uniref:Uncharacterized protein n=1 Tax=Ephemerocybe angulata TaxID=980116 RepID=A0A8H6M1G1_9AGAR|nr:hypothetical protein DFP72DRAFT_1074661 [Tulosesus angulatus]